MKTTFNRFSVNAHDFFNRGIAKHNQGEYAGAIADYNQAIRLNPDDADTFHNRGFAKVKLEQYAGAIADYNEAIRLNPDDAGYLS